MLNADSSENLNGPLAERKKEKEDLRQVVPQGVLHVGRKFRKLSAVAL